MEIEVHLSLSALKSAVRRLVVRLDDGDQSCDGLVEFRAQDDSVQIAAGVTSEILDASVKRGGHGTLPSKFFRGIARALRFHRKREVILVALSEGCLRIDGTEYRRPHISVCFAGAEPAASVAKPTKLQNQ